MNVVYSRGTEPFECEWYHDQFSQQLGQARWSINSECTSASLQIHIYRVMVSNRWLARFEEELGVQN